MRIRPEWKIQHNNEELIPANVPGNVQSDYAEFYGWGDVNYADNCIPNTTILKKIHGIIVLNFVQNMQQMNGCFFTAAASTICMI